MLNVRQPKMIAIIDASSAILLSSAGLHKVLTEMYNVVMPGSVYSEITANSYPGSKEYQQLRDIKKVTLVEPMSDNKIKETRPGLNNLDRGEHDVITSYYTGQGDFIIIDDGAAARYCKRKSIPFINALLVPVILGSAGMKDEDYCLELMKIIIEKGRYSPPIIEYALKCKKDDLSFFMP